MLKVKFADNREIECLYVNGSKQQYQGFNRDTLEFVFKFENISLDELNNIFNNQELTSTMYLITDTQLSNGEPSVQSFRYDDYILKVSITMRPEVIQSESSDNPEITEDRVYVSMAQLTYIEKRLKILNII